MTVGGATPTPRIEVVTLGEALVSFVATTPGPLAEARVFERHIAGAEANVAVGLARLGHAVAFVGRVGDDGFGTAIRRHLRGEGVDVRHLVTDPAATTGIMFRERRALSAIDVVYARAASAGSRLEPEDIERVGADGILAGASWLHLTGITPALSDRAHAAVVRARDLASAAGLTISLDVNLRRRLWSDEVAAPVLRSIAAGADVVLGSPDELATIADRPDDPSADPADLARAVLDLGPSVAVVKLGGAGALALSRDGEPVAAPAVPVSSVVDPVGAGDAFCAGFIAARLEGADVAGALRAGNACGASAVAASGDMAGLPERAELERLLAGGGPDTLR
jgi:2-dehydro-3-deoxygluconokinase